MPHLPVGTLDDEEPPLLCSNGLWNTLGDDEIILIMRTAPTSNDACQALVDACNATGSLDIIAAVPMRPRLTPQS